MSNWKEYKLGDFAEIQTGPFGSQLHASDYVEHGIPSIMPTNIGSRLNIDTTEIACVSEHDIKRLEKYTVKETDIVYSRRGDVEKCAYITSQQNGWLCGTGCLRIRFTSKEIVPRFCSYYLSTPNIRSWVTNNAVGTTMPNLNSKILQALPLNIPSLREQESIAEILSSLDDKIDLLYHQNKTLEEMAGALFRQWFMEEAKPEWEVKSLEQIFDIAIGRTPPRKEQHWFSEDPSHVKWVSIKDMGNPGIYLDTVSEYLTPEAIAEFSVPIIPANTLMLSFKMTIGRLAITTEKMVSNEAIAHFKIRENSYLFPEFLYLYFKSYNWQQLGSTSSIVEAINSQMIKEIEITLPSEDELQKFQKLIMPSFSKVRQNQKQIQTLTQLRDSILPKLMSGEIALIS